MQLMTGKSPLALWQDVVKLAENRCSIKLQVELEAYLVSLLIRYSDKPEVAQQVFATTFLEAMQAKERQRNFSLQNVGDQCLLFAGLFPRAAQRKQVKINYFVDLGRSAYANISQTANDLYWSLAIQFVALMDVLQSIRCDPDLLPLEAYEQWNDLDSQRALQILKEYAHGIPLKKNKHF